MERPQRSEDERCGWHRAPAHAGGRRGVSGHCESGPRVVRVRGMIGRCSGVGMALVVVPLMASNASPPAPLASF